MKLGLESSMRENLTEARIRLESASRRARRISERRIPASDTIPCPAPLESEALDDDGDECATVPFRREDVS